MGNPRPVEYQSKVIQIQQPSLAMRNRPQPVMYRYSHVYHPFPIFQYIFQVLVRRSYQFKIELILQYLEYIRRDKSRRCRPYPDALYIEREKRQKYRNGFLFKPWKEPGTREDRSLRN